MEIRELTMEGLNSLMHSEEISTWSSLPISPLRLSSQNKNPHLLYSDIVMILIVDNNDLAGYLGALPDNIKYNELTEHVAWASCIWTNPVYRGKGVAKQLTQAMNSAWGGKLFLTEFTAAAKSIYDKLGLFDTFCIKTGERFFYNAIFYEIVKNRYVNNRITLQFIKILDTGLNIFIKIRTYLKLKLSKQISYSYKEVNLNNVAENIIPQSLFANSIEKNKWIYFNHWLSNEKKDECIRYYFSTMINLFDFRTIVFSDAKGMPVAHLVFSQINKDCKILFLSFDKKTEIQFSEIKKSIEHLFVSEHVNTVLSYDVNYNKVMQQKNSLFFYRKSRKREYLCSKNLLNKIPAQYRIASELDGDIVFT